jgi:type II secretory pathway pseudopilin PulG
MKKQLGFSLIELLIVIVLIIAVSAIAVSRGFYGSSTSHGAEQFMNDAATRLFERRQQAQRLNGATAADSFNEAPAPPLEFDFENPATTASLIIEGEDANRDGVDDVTGQRLTTLRVNYGSMPVRASWDAAYRDDAIKIPAGWKLAASETELGAIPLIAAGAKGRGILVTRIGFDGDGRALYRNESGVWETAPSGAAGSKRIAETAFWAFYFIRASGDGSSKSGRVNNDSAIAIAIYPSSGIVERFRWDGNSWRGFSDRVITSK